jgi:hypothetical protein
MTTRPELKILVCNVSQMSSAQPQPPISVQQILRENPGHTMFQQLNQAVRSSASATTSSTRSSARSNSDLSSSESDTNCSPSAGSTSSTTAVYDFRIYSQAPSVRLFFMVAVDVCLDCSSFLRVILPPYQQPLVYLRHPALKIPSRQRRIHLTLDSNSRPQTSPTVAGILLTCLNPNFNLFRSAVRFSKR